jgi:IS1 family transposase
MEEYEDDGTWIWVGFAPEHRLVIAHSIGERKQHMADDIVRKTIGRISGSPLYVTDGLKFYTKALLKNCGSWMNFPRTGKRGRPRKAKLVPDPNLKYAQVVKHRRGGKLSKVEKRVIFGDNVNLRDISTSLIERQNLTFRQDNNRISRKTIGFSKERLDLDNQMTLYYAHFNFCRGHGSLRYRDDNNRVKKSCLARSAGLIDRNMTLRELLSFPYHITSTS